MISSGGIATASGETAAALTLGLLAAPAHATASPRLLRFDYVSATGFVVRPAQISLAGDGGEILGGAGWTQATDLASYGRIAWSTYDQREAVGSGLLWFNDCDPYCAAGTYHQHTATVHAFAVRRNRYTRLTVRYTDNGRTQFDRRILRRHGGLWAWDQVR